MYDFEFGSRTAKGGFANEKEICKKFNNWKEDEDAKLWLKIMGYDLNKIYGVPSIHNPVSIRTTPYTKQIANSSSILMGHNHITLNQK